MSGWFVELLVVLFCIGGVEVRGLPILVNQLMMHLHAHILAQSIYLNFHFIYMHNEKLCSEVVLQAVVL